MNMQRKVTTDLESKRFIMAGVENLMANKAAGKPVIDSDIAYLYGAAFMALHARLLTQVDYHECLKAIRSI